MNSEVTAFESVNPSQTAVAPIGEPVPPRGTREDEVLDLKRRAVEVVERLRDATGSKEMDIIDGITSVGVQAQRQAGADLELLRTRVGQMVMRDGPGARLSTDLVNLRMTLNQIDPNQVGRESFVRRLVQMAPFGEKHLLRVLETVAVRYESVSRQVVLIETRLREGRTMLARDNIELRKLFEQVEAQQVPIRKTAFLGELVMHQLDQLLQETEELQKRDRIQGALFDVAIRVEDLRVMEEVHSQLFVSIEMTRQNNTRLGQAVDRTVTLATNVVTIGLAIQAALGRQAMVFEATNRTREFLGNMLVANAASIKRHTGEIGDVYKSPVIAIDKIIQAHNELLEAMDMADRLKSEGIAAARENIVKLARLANELEDRAVSLSDPGRLPSLEA